MRSNVTRSNKLVSVFGVTVVVGKKLVKFVTVLRLALTHAHAHLWRLAAERMAPQGALIAIPASSGRQCRRVAMLRDSRRWSRSDSQSGYRQS